MSKLVLRSIGLNADAYALDHAQVALVINGVSTSLATITDNAAASSVDAASSIANAINAAAIQHNGKTVSAVAYSSIIAIALVEADGESGVSINAVTGLSDASSWTATDLQNPYVDPNAGVVNKADVNTATIVAFAAGAALARMVK